MHPFHPIVSNPHLLTIAANLWPRHLDSLGFPVEDHFYQTEPGVQVLVREQRPKGSACGEVLLVHGLEGSSEAGYMRSATQRALEAGFVAHRLNLRSCGGTEALAPTMYHAGLTSDILAVLLDLQRRDRTPVFLAGFSLGGNIVLKLAGELGEKAAALIAGVCAVSASIDLSVCVRRLAARENRLYENRFVRLMKQRLRRKHELFPDRFPIDGLDRVRSVLDIDEQFTAPSFGFRDAAHYYATQSARNNLEGIRVPALLIQAQDDTLVPFDLFQLPVFGGNPWLRLENTPHGGHLGFLSRHTPRFWLDHAMIGWFLELQRNKTPAAHVHSL